MIENKKFSKLTAVRFSYKKNRKHYWLCLCDCGNETIVEKAKLKSGHTKSCGCYKLQRISESHTKHGCCKSNKLRTPEHSAWSTMKQRCYDKNTKSYHNYGGRGITVCDRWLNSFENFLKDMGPKPSPQHSIDRIDSSGNYEPSNCRWATREEQHMNRRVTYNVIWRGKITSLKDLCQSKSLSYHTIWQRIERLNWDIEKSINTPIRSY